MSARVTQNPHKMTDIRLHAIPTSQIYRSVSLILGGVHIRGVRRRWPCIHGIGLDHAFPFPLFGCLTMEKRPPLSCYLARSVVNVVRINVLELCGDRCATLRSIAFL